MIASTYTTLNTPTPETKVAKMEPVLEQKDLSPTVLKDIIDVVEQGIVFASLTTVSYTCIIRSSPMLMGKCNYLSVFVFICPAMHSSQILSTQ